MSDSDSVIKRAAARAASLALEPKPDSESVPVSHGRISLSLSDTGTAARAP